jgi:hypothetical protein
LASDLFEEALIASMTDSNEYLAVIIFSRLSLPAAISLIIEGNMP